MCPELENACKEVQELISRSDARDAIDRHAIGCIIRDVRDAEHTYGEGAVAKIAHAVGRDADTLYEYANVAETWSHAEIKRLMARKTALGVPLSFSHLVVLSRVRNRPDLLTIMTERALEGVSVRHLRSLTVRERRRKKVEAPVVTFGRSVAVYDRVVSLMRSLEPCLAVLGSTAPSERLVSLLERALDANASLKALCRDNAGLLERELARVRARLGPGEEELPAVRPPTIPIIPCEERTED
jgi:hypothetical protein